MTLPAAFLAGLRTLAASTAGVCLAAAANAAAFTPTQDSQILARVPARALDAQARELQALRAAWRAAPRDVDTAVALVRRYVEAAAADGDPRYMGYAQAALAPWWNEAAPPVEVRVQRAVLRQYGHGFDDAIADLQAAVVQAPGHAEAWAWLAAIHLVRADYAAAAAACDKLAPLSTPLNGVACRASVDSLTGRAAAASVALAVALKAATDASPAERVWALTRQAEIAERRGSIAVAERAFDEALATGVPDVYLRAAHADFLLDQGRSREVLALLADAARADVLLLRLAIAGKASGDPRTAAWTQDLAARFAAARARGDSTHEKEEARFVLELQGDATRALALARSNYAVQREPADARILLEAALAARQPEAALPVRRWLEAHRVESVRLRSLAARLPATP